MKILRASDHKVMPWRNGGGTTTEIAVSPPGASLDTFDWRVSMATVASDGPFSLFPGIDRTLAILDGLGMTLEIAGREPVTLDGSFAPLTFAADVPCSARLLSGPILDLNVMSRRGRFRHSVERMIVEGQADWTAPADSVALLLARDAMSVRIAESTTTMSRDDALRFDALNETRCEFTANGRVVVFVIALTRPV